MEVDILDKYRNIQFLLHLVKVLGLNNVMIFLTDWVEDPDLYLSEMLKQYKYQPFTPCEQSVLIQFGLSYLTQNFDVKSINKKSLILVHFLRCLPINNYLIIKDLTFLFLKIFLEFHLLMVN